MKKIIIVFLLFPLFNISYTDAQVNQEWVATYHTDLGYNSPKRSAIDNSNNLIIAGTSDSGNYDYIVLKYSSSGNLLWERRYNGAGNGSDYIHNMVLDDSGNIYVTGVSWAGPTMGKYNWVTIKYKPNGETSWVRSLNWTGNESDEPFGMVLDKDRNLIINGYGKTNSLYQQMITVKYNRDGDTIWSRIYLPLSNRYDIGYSLITDDSNNIYSSGYGQIPTGNEIVTIKYSSIGREKWVRKYPTYYGDLLRPTFSALDDFNNLVVVGYNYRKSSAYGFVTLKYSLDGKLIWSRLFDDGGDDYAHSLFLDNESNILICGSSETSTSGDYLIVKYSPSGDTLLLKKIDGGASLYDRAYFCVSDINYNIYVTGYFQSLSGLNSYLTLKMNPQGITIWSKTYSTPYDNYAYFLSLDNNDNVYVSGECFLPDGNTGIVSIKYSQLTGLSNQGAETINKYRLENYPNPFNPETKISYEIPVSNNILIRIFDVLGNVIKTLVNDFQNKGSYNVIFDGSNFSSGIYFCSLYINNNLIDTRRMLLLK